MRRILCYLGWGGLVLSLLAMPHRARGAEPNPAPPNQPAAPDPEMVFQNLDTNRDGVIEEKEIPHGLPRKDRAFLKAADKNGDGLITKDEFMAAVARVKDARVKAANPKAISLTGPTPPPISKRAVPSGVKLEANLAYVEGGSEQNRLDLYLPDFAAEPVPVVVWIHGGAWQAGSKEDCHAVPLVLKGFALASINYRLSSQAAFPAQIEDCKAAIRWLRAHAEKYRLNGAHVGVWGESAGGHLAALLGTSGDVKEWDTNGGCQDQSSRVQAVCDWFGPSDLTRTSEKADLSAVKKLLGDPTTDLKQKAATASPITYVSKNAAPFLIFHGDKDETVPLEQSQLLADALQKTGVESSLQVIPGAGHGGPDFASEENQNRILEFFTTHLSATPAQ